MTAVLLATKCPHCKTKFKVANDQLKLQAGLVRCGICHQVFNGIENLATADNVSQTIKINPPTAKATAANQTLPAQKVSEPVEQQASSAELEYDMFDEFNLSSAQESEKKLEPTIEPENDILPIEEKFFGSVLSDEFQPTQAPADFHAKVQALLDADLEADKQFSDQPLIPDDAQIEEIVVAEVDYADQTIRPTRLSDLRGMMSVDSEAESSEEETSDDELAELKFIRQANSKKWMTRLFAVASVILFVVLIGQGLYQFRDLIAAAYPSTKDTLVSMCKLANCQVNLPAQLDAVSYEADELHSLPRDKTFEFSMLLRNHSAITQAWPYIELTLKDSKKQVVLKKILQPSDYLSTSAEVLNGLQGNAEQAIKVYFVLDQLKASDYVVAIFYP